MRAIPAGDKTILVGQYMTEKTGAHFEPGMYSAMAVLDDDGIFIAGVVFSNFRGHDVEVSCATESSTAWRPSVMAAVFSYVFVQLGCVRCTSVTKKNNKRSREFLERLGFALEGNIRLGYDGLKDALIYGLLASECRYLPGNLNGQEVNASSPGSTGPGSDGSGAIDGEQRGSGSAS